MNETTTTTTTTTITTVDEERDDKDDDEYEDDDKPLFGYRDLTKTKARLMKGDEMLDRSFENFGYHLLDDPSMSELGAYVQSARNLSKNMLQEFVRPVWEPNSTRNQFSAFLKQRQMSVYPDSITIRAFSNRP